MQHHRPRHVDSNLKHDSMLTGLSDFSVRTLGAPEAGSSTELKIFEFHIVYLSLFYPHHSPTFLIRVNLHQFYGAVSHVH